MGGGGGGGGGGGLPYFMWLVTVNHSPCTGDKAELNKRCQKSSIPHLSEGLNKAYVN